MSLMLQNINQSKVKSYNLARFLRSQLKCKPSLSLQEPVPVFRKATNFYNRVALRDCIGNYTYGNISLAAKELSREISKKIDENINSQVTFLCPNDASYVITQWAIWMSGQAAVPVSTTYSFEMIKYFARNSESKLLITTPENSELFERVAADTNIDLMILNTNIKETALTRSISKFSSDNTKPFDVDDTNAMVLYTSGSTGCPKGVVLTHKQIINQVDALVDAWKLTSDDTFLHTLPLHQSHGIINGLLCPFYVGAKCIMLPKFNPNDVWSHLLGIKSAMDRQKITVFMGTSNIYTLLIEEYNNLFSSDPKIEDYIRSSIKSRTRLMTCGADFLSSNLYQKWYEIAGHKLLQHYGMTETGMLFSQRCDDVIEHGYVGLPLKGCSLRIRKMNDDNKYETLLDCTNNNNILKVKFEQRQTSLTGELLLRGDGLFKKYLNKSVDNEFTDDSWFKSGDTCEYSNKKKMFKILGRTDVDIIDNGSFKISASQVETQLLAHPEISDCAVLGVPDHKLGHCLAAIVVLKNEISDDMLKDWMEANMSTDSVPKIIKVVHCIPKNAMGKVNKAELSVQMFVNNQELQQ